ncbi:Hypp5830 [Branchiostoma lanceolatum]|uniref:Hypp5830 protein n=1 Tax=Branchiostoma lanceolatum TaxID=7740 RepID=A0A8J9YR33_BRALA|nr:Hypp5830 [Branchiostoma lanceolatum]
MSLLYRPPGQRVVDCAPIDWYTENLDRLRTKTKATGTLLTGDYNAHHKEWLLSKKTDPPGRHTLTLCTTHGLSQLVNGATHRKGNRLDLIMSDAPSLCTQVQIDPEIGKSDHYLLSTSISCSPVQEKTTPRKIWIYQKADWDALRNELAQANWDSMLDPDNPELSCTNVTKTIQQAMEHHIPKKTLRIFTGKPEWYNESCERALQKKHKTWRQYKAKKTPESRSIYNRARNSYTYVTRKAINNHKKRIKEKMTTGLKKGSKSWWWTAKRLMGQGGKCDIPLLSSENQSYIHPEEKAECFANIFAEKSTIPRDENDKDVPLVESKTASRLKNVVFWPKQVQKVLTKLDISKATGPDSIPARVLKHAAPELSRPLAKLFQLLLNKHHMPKQWKVAHVIPVHKKNSKHDPNNYRPISLLCIISKVMEAIINKALWQHIDKNSLISDKQFGFRAGHSTADALTYVTQHLHDAKDKRQESRLICLDISRAFDRVWHRGLIAKLKAIGVDGHVLKWFENYLADRELKATISGKTSTARLINAGVPQGSILGPLLFILYIDDLTEKLTNTAMLYADDSSIMRIMERRERARAALSLNTDLQKIQNWADCWNVLFGASKCKCLTASNLKDAEGNHPELNFMNTTLAEVDEAELLGLTIRKELSWTHHIKKMATDAGKRLGLLRRAAPYLTPQQRATIYKSMVRSCMEYASTVWMGACPTSLDLLDAIQRRAIRLINLPQDELDRNQIQPLGQRRNVGALTLLHRMYNHNAPSPLISLLPGPYVHRRETRLSRSQHCNALEPVKSSTTSHRRTYLPATVKLWNSLPQDIVTLKDKCKFKTCINRHLSVPRQRPTV